MNRQCNISLLLSLCFTFLISVAAECSDTEVARCVFIVHRHLQRFGRDIRTEVIDHVCRDLPITENCLMNLTCTESDTDVVTLWQGTRDGYTYVCREDSVKDVLLNNQCLKAAITNNAFQRCDAQFNETVLQDPTSVCSSSKTLLKCLEEVLSGCESHVVRSYITTQYKILKPVTTLSTGCVFNQPLFTSAAFQSAAPSILLLFAMFVYSMSA